MNFIQVLEELMTPQIPFKIYWPLVVEKHKHRTKNHDNALFYRYAILWWLCTYFVPIYYRTLCLFADSLLHIKIASGFGQPYLLFIWCSKVIRKTNYYTQSLTHTFLRSGKNLHDPNCSTQVIINPKHVSEGIFSKLSDFLDFLGLCVFLHIKIACGCDIFWKKHLGFGFLWNFFRIIWFFCEFFGFFGTLCLFCWQPHAYHMFLDFYQFFSEVSGLCASLLRASCISR